jgi:hypothetical protein
MACYGKAAFGAGLLGRVRSLPPGDGRANQYLYKELFMGGRGPQSFKKRQKEQQRKEKQQEKLAKKIERKQQSLLDPSADDDLLFLDEDGQPLDPQPVRPRATEPPSAEKAAQPQSVEPQ